ncbi:MAG: anti-sigma factor [Planctomycetes bacterium]|nr:anti-sigma factor [Planctomycetota bacterium]
MNCTDCHDAMMEYALGALPATEAEGIRAHLAQGCVPCRSALAEAREVLGSVPLALVPVAPPRALKERILSAISRTEADQAPPRQHPAGRMSWWIPLAWAASLIITATVAGSLQGSRAEESQRDATTLFNDQIAQRDRRLLALQADADQRTDRLTTLERSLVAAHASITSLKDSYAAKDARLAMLEKSLRSARDSLSVLRAANLQLVTLVAQGPQPAHARARVLFDTDARMWQVVASGLAPPKAGRTFELWYITVDQQKIPAGTFDCDGQGDADAIFHVPPGVGEIAMAAITDEPIGGVQVPTGEIHLAGAMK